MAISIIIPAYNRASIIGKTLDSIINQTSIEWECIVVDDFSADNTKDVVASYMAINPQISYYINEGKKGAQGARNTGLKYSKFDWVVFFDSDNIMHDDFIYAMCSNLHKNTNVDVIACCADVIDVFKGKTGRVMNPHCEGYIHDGLFNGSNYVDFNQAIIRKSKLLEIGGLDEDCPSMQEWDTHIRLSKIANYSMIDKILVDYFRGSTDRISSDTKREVIGRLYILRKHNKEWRHYIIGLTRFCYQIYCVIKRNDDSTFIKEKTDELRSLVPFLGLRIGAVKLYNKVGNKK